MVGKALLHGNTPLQHYLCYHIFHNDSSYGNSIFNTTYNIELGGMYGGNFSTGLWFGAGAAVVDILSSVICNYASPSKWFSGGGGVSSSGRSKHSSKPKTKVVYKDKYDKDNKEFAKASKELEALKNKSNITADDLNKLYSSVLKAKEAQDDIAKDDDTDTYEHFLGEIKEFASGKGFKFKDGKFVEKIVVQTPINEESGKDEVSITLNFAEHNGVKDPKIAGEIESVKLDENDKTKVKEYVINCGKDVGGHTNQLKLRYLVTYKGDNKYNVKCISTSHNHKQSNGKPMKLYIKNDGIDYTLDQANCILRNPTNNVLVSREKLNGYKELSYSDKPEEPRLYEGHKAADKFNITSNQNCCDIQLEVEKEKAEE